MEAAHGPQAQAIFLPTFASQFLLYYFLALHPDQTSSLHSLLCVSFSSALLDQGDMQTWRVKMYTPPHPTHVGLASRVAQSTHLAQSTYSIHLGHYFWLSHFTHPAKVCYYFITLGLTGKSLLVVKSSVMQRKGQWMENQETWSLA